MTDDISSSSSRWRQPSHLQYSSSWSIMRLQNCHPSFPLKAETEAARCKTSIATKTSLLQPSTPPKHAPGSQLEPGFSWSWMKEDRTTLVDPAKSIEHMPDFQPLLLYSQLSELQLSAQARRRFHLEDQRVEHHGHQVIPGLATPENSPE
jgi:hypothetical protein